MADLGGTAGFDGLAGSPASCPPSHQHPAPCPVAPPSESPVAADHGEQLCLRGIFLEKEQHDEKQTNKKSNIPGAWYM